MFRFIKKLTTYLSASDGVPAEAVYVDAAGQVGIGITGPTNKLHILDGTTKLEGTAGTAQLYIAHQTTGNQYSSIIFGYDQGTANVATPSAIRGYSVDAGTTHHSELRFATTPSGTGTEAGILDRMTITNLGNVGIGTITPDALLHAEKTSALTNTVQPVARISHITSGAPAAGIGVGMEFEQETTAGNEVIATINAVTTDVTSGSEDADIVISTMAAGAAVVERLRIASTGTITSSGDIVCGGIVALNVAASAPDADGEVGYDTTYKRLRFYNGSELEFIDPRAGAVNQDRLQLSHITLHIGAVGASAGGNYAAFSAKETMRIQEISIWARAEAGTADATVDVRDDAATILSAVTTIAAAATMYTASIATRLATIAEGSAVSIYITTDGDGSLGDLTVDIAYYAS